MPSRGQRFSSPASSRQARSTQSMSSMDDPCALRNNGHPSKSENGRPNGAQAGDTVQCSGPFPSHSHSAGGGATPMRRLLSPGVSERCSSTVSGQGSEETPLWPMGYAGKTDAHAGFYTSLTHTFTQLHPPHPGGPRATFKEIST